MNNWGAYGCERRFDEIVRHLVDRAKRKHIPEMLSRGVAEMWLRSAIDSSKSVFPSNGDTWAVVVTAAPRTPSTLATCVNSIRNAGWEPTVIGEPGTIEVDAEMVVHDTKKGCWHNWIAAARYAIELSGADRILIAQDDTLFHPDTRRLIEESIEVTPDKGLISLYTPMQYALGKSPGVFPMVTRNLWGACALVFHREALERILSHDLINRWNGMGPLTKTLRERAVAAGFTNEPEIRAEIRRMKADLAARRRADPSLVNNADAAVSRICNALKLKMYWTHPSPVQHFATTSTIGHGGNGKKRNCRPCADHSIPLADQVFP